MTVYAKAKSLREQRAALVEKATAIHRGAQGRDLTPDEQRAWDAIHSDADDLRAQIDQVEAEIVRHESRAQPSASYSPCPAPDARTAARAQAINTWLRGGHGALTPEERRALAPTGEALRSARELDPRVGIGNAIVVRMGEQRAQSTTDAAGGYTIDTEVAPAIDVALSAFGGVRRVATILRTAAGADLPMPTVNDTGNTGALLAENTQDSEQDLTFGAVTLGAYKYTSRIIRVSIELMQDSAFDLAAHIGERLGERLGRIGNTHQTTGTGSGQPNGVVTASTLGTTAASTTAITSAEMLDLKHSVDPAYRTNGSWMFNDTTLKALKQLSVGTGDSRPLWQAGIGVGEPDTIDGDPYTINQDMASPAASAKTALYGNFRKFIIREVMDIVILRLAERYADYGQVGFVAFARMDADLLDAGTNPIKHLAQAAS